MNEFFKAIRSFIIDYLPKQRCCSENTVTSYRQSLNLMITFLREVKGLKIGQINFEVFQREVVIEFLSWLETERHCGTTTRNQRLMALRSFFKYAGLLDCTKMAVSLDIRDVPIKKTKGKTIEFLSENALTAILNQPNINDRTGLRNQFFMVLMYDTAARCGELLQLRLVDLKIDNPSPSVHLFGKGSKPRIVPLLPKTVEHCKRYLKRYHQKSNENDYLFFTTLHGERKPMSADTVGTFVRNYGELALANCPDIPLRIHPHMFRHSRAMHYYSEGMPLVLLSELLGHSDPETTKIYAYADSSMKRSIMEKVEPIARNSPPATAIWADDEDMILKLSGLK